MTAGSWVETAVSAGFGVETGVWAEFEVGVLWGTEFVDADASIGADERAGWMVTEVEHAEPEPGSGAELGFGQAVTEFSEGRTGADHGFGMGAVGAVVGAGHAW